MAHSTRRDFLKAGVAATVLSGIGGAAAAASTKRSATDWVTLGKSNIKVTRLAFGTGTHGGRVQRELGQEEFTKLVRHAPTIAASASSRRPKVIAACRKCCPSHLRASPPTAISS